MGYRVKSVEGEIAFEHFGDLEKAYRQGLVDPADDVLETGQTRWMKAGEIKLLKGVEPGAGSLWVDPSKRWYAIATILAVGGLVMVVVRNWWVTAVIGLLVLFAVLAYTTKQSVNRKRPRRG